MKYKKQIATSALALSLLVIGSSVYAATPQDVGVKVVQSSQQKQNKVVKEVKNKKSNIVGTVSNISSTGFTVDVKNIKTKIVTPFDVKTDATTVYKKNGIVSSASDLAVGQKVTVVGFLDKTTNIIDAKQVRIIVIKVKASKTIIKK